MNTYVALLRGINVGGKTIKMEALKHVFGSLGFQNVKTFLTSGNVLFDAEETDKKKLILQIKKKLLEAFEFEITIALREKNYIKALVERNPFSKVSVSPELRLYVSFLAEETNKSIEIPYVSPQKDFQIISMTGCELFSVLEAGGKTTDAMDLIEKKFGKKVTTRNWNTVKKLAA